MTLDTPRRITMENGATAIAVAEFNNGYSCIVADDGCWMIVNGDRKSAHIFPEACVELRKLPDRPADHKPLMDFLRSST